MRLIYTFFFVFFLVATSFGQTFKLSELINMSKMNVDDFDTYVTSREFVFLGESRDMNFQGVNYAYKLNPRDKSEAKKHLTLYTRLYDFKNAITYQTFDKNEYLVIKNQIKNLGFIFKNSKVHTSKEGLMVNSFVYKKGKAEISLYVDLETFEINYKVLKN